MKRFNCAVPERRKRLDSPIGAILDSTGTYLYITICIGRVDSRHAVHHNGVCAGDIHRIGALECRKYNSVAAVVAGGISEDKMLDIAVCIYLAEKHVAGCDSYTLKPLGTDLYSLAREIIYYLAVGCDLRSVKPAVSDRAGELLELADLEERNTVCRNGYLDHISLPERACGIGIAVGVAVGSTDCDISALLNIAEAVGKSLSAYRGHNSVYDILCLIARKDIYAGAARTKKQCNAVARLYCAEIGEGINSLRAAERAGSARYGYR